MYNTYNCVCSIAKNVLRLLVFHTWSYNGSYHEVVKDEEYWHSIFGHTVAHTTRNK